MKLKSIILAFFASVALCGSLMSAPAMAEVKSFSAIDGIDAQALTATEMDAIHGEGRGLDIAIARIEARLERGFPRLEAKHPELAAKISAGLERVLARLNAIRDRINARTAAR